MDKINHSNPVPIHEQLKNIILKQIEEGILLPGQKIPSERELSSLYDVSRATSKNAVLSLMNEGYVIRITGKGTFIKQNLKIHERNKKLKKIISYIVNIPKEMRIKLHEDPLYYTIYEGIQEIAKVHGFHILFTYTSDDPEELESLKASFDKVDGIIFTELSSINIRQILKRSGLPVVLILPQIDEYSFDAVYSDETQVAKIALNYLYKLKHENIGIINGPLNCRGGRVFFKEYQDFMERKKIPIKDTWISGNNTWRFQSGFDAMSELMEKQNECTAVFAANDLLALGALKYAQEHSIRVPDDISIIGANNISASAISSPPLTTIDMHPKEVGMYATKRMLERLDGQYPFYIRINVQCSLIERHTCRTRR